MQSRFLFLMLTLLCLAGHASAESPGQAGFRSVHACVMRNDPAFCTSVLTPDSIALFKRFYSYKLMPCLPTDFAYSSEKTVNNRTTVKATTAAGNGETYILWLVFDDTPSGPKLSLPASFERGMGEDWRDKIAMSEQLYLMMRQNMGDRLGCDQLNGLLKPR